MLAMYYFLMYTEKVSCKGYYVSRKYKLIVNKCKLSFKGNFCYEVS